MRNFLNFMMTISDWGSHTNPYRFILQKPEEVSVGTDEPLASPSLIGAD